MEEQKLTREEARDRRVEEALREGIVPERLYEPYVAAALLGIRSKRAEKTLAEIPEAILPVQRVGPSGGLRRYYGRNLISYIHASGGVLEEVAA